MNITVLEHMKRIEIIMALFLAMCLCMTGLQSVYAKKKSDTPVRITLDAGHGGDDSGDVETHNGKTIAEKDVNLKIANALKEYLESNYTGIEVSMTRDSDTKPELLERTQIAESQDADYLISLHNNAAGDAQEYDHGSSVLTGRGVYQKKLCKEEQKLACNILDELEEFGLENQGILLRQCENGSKYENGELCDYYAIIRNGLKYNIPSIIIEHSFLDKEEDYELALSDDDKIQKLAEADGRGIARYFQLEDKDGNTIESLEDYKVKLTLKTDDNDSHDEISYKTFYKTTKEDSSKKVTTAKAVTEATTAAKKAAEEPVKKSIWQKIAAWFRNIF